jgi:hypothetical protein
MYHPPSLLSLTVSSGYEWAESKPVLGSHGFLSFTFYALLDAYKEER